MIVYGSEISRILYGSNEIGEVYYGSDKVFGGSQSSYVTDGLVLWLDGIDHGTGSDWVDKVSGIIYSNDGGVSFGDDYAQFTGDSSKYFYNSTFIAPSKSAGTIEVVVEPTNLSTNGIVFIPQSGSERLAFGFYQSKVIWGNANGSLYVASSGKKSYSVSSVMALCNGAAMSASGSNYYTSQSSTTSYIGKRSGRANQQTPFNGKVYCIRIYNKQLTNAEVLANLAVDNTRFNLGLTL